MRIARSVLFASLISPLLPEASAQVDSAVWGAQFNGFHAVVVHNEVAGFDARVFRSPDNPYWSATIAVREAVDDNGDQFLLVDVSATHVHDPHAGDDATAPTAHLTLDTRTALPYLPSGNLLDAMDDVGHPSVGHHDFFDLSLAWTSAGANSIGNYILTFTGVHCPTSNPAACSTTPPTPSTTLDELVVFDAGCAGEASPYLSEPSRASTGFTIHCPEPLTPCFGGLSPIMLFGACTPSPLLLPPTIGCGSCWLAVDPSWGTAPSPLVVGPGLPIGFEFCVQCGCVAQPPSEPPCVDVSKRRPICVADDPPAEPCDGGPTQAPDESEPNDSCATATPSNCCDEHTNTLQVPNDVDFYCLTLTERTTVTWETHADTSTTGTTVFDTRIWLYDSACNEIDSNDDGGAGFYSRLEVTLEPGTYYTEVAHWTRNGTGDYKLTIDCRPPEPNPVSDLQRIAQTLSQIRGALQTIRNLPAAAGVHDDIDQIIDRIDLAETSISAAIADFAGLSQAELQAVILAYELMAPYIEQALTALQNAADDLDAKIALFPLEPLGDTVEVVGEALDGLGTALDNLGTQIQEEAPLVGNTIGGSVRVVGGALKIVGSVIDAVASLWPF